MFTINGNGKEIAELFKKFGLTEYESRVYFTLQVSGKTRVGKLWVSAGVPQSKVYNTIQILSTKGLIETTNLSPLEIRAKPFLRFANEYLTDRKCSLYEIQEKIDNYKEVTKNRAVKVII
ncbi:MAG: TrmB family transcriptional regulator [Candidatus Nitrosotenuis sp.]|nr:MAG: TrmB family transcriptional regulator [Candidatus Nitrosotenuis sp.]